MAIGDFAKEIQNASDSKLRERLREVDPASPGWSGINAELEWRASQEMLRASQEMYRQTRSLIRLTWVIAFLTAALLVYTIVTALI
jgi:hypothetical protein